MARKKFEGDRLVDKIIKVSLADEICDIGRRHQVSRWHSRAFSTQELKRILRVRRAKFSDDQFDTVFAEMKKRGIVKRDLSCFGEVYRIEF